MSKLEFWNGFAVAAGLTTSDALTVTDANVAVMVTVVGDVTEGALIVNVAVVCSAGTVTEEPTWRMAGES